jgi:hypothetical protein
MDTLIPLWIIGGPFVGVLILSFAFKGPSAMGGPVPRLVPRRLEVHVARETSVDRSAPVLEPMHPDAPRRLV